MADSIGCFGKTTKKDQNTRKKDRLRNSRILLGDMRHIDPTVRRLYELALPENLSKCGNFFAPYETTPEQFEKLRFERQTFSQWKVQREFQKLHYRLRTRMKRKIIYILPIGSFPNFVLEKIPGLATSLFEVLCNFVSVFYLGFSVEMLNVVDLNEISCKTRVHPGTGKLQILVGDVLLYLKKRLPKDGFCIVGISWEDLYPGDEWNFVLGEASCEGGCAAMSFGHHEPNASQRLHTMVPKVNKNNHVGERVTFRSVKRGSMVTDCSKELESISSLNHEQSKKYSNLDVGDNVGKSTDKADDSKPMVHTQQDWQCPCRDKMEVHVRNNEDQCIQDLSTYYEHKTNISGDGVDEFYCSNGLENECEIMASEERIPTCIKDSAQDLVYNGDINKPVEVGSAEGSSGGHSSCCGIENKFGRIKRIDAFEIWKFFRVVSHELGHVFGITHCSYFSCAMNESTSIDDAVNQPLFMCPVCLRKIQKATGFDIVDRYTRLRHFLETLHTGLLQAGPEGKLDNHITFTGNQCTDDNNSYMNKLQRFSMATCWIDSVLSFLENE